MKDVEFREGGAEVVASAPVVGVVSGVEIGERGRD
jgi:hypothetical protein